jgi:hypothetical protein
VLVLRLFVQAETRESPGEVFRALEVGAIGSFHAFKWRLAMALQSDSRRGVGLDEVWRAWHDAGIDPLKVAARTGWSPGSIGTIDHYQGKPSRLTFPTWAEYLDLLGDLFEVLEFRRPGYELGERCPLVACRPRQPLPL